MYSLGYEGLVSIREIHAWLNAKQIVAEIDQARKAIVFDNPADRKKCYQWMTGRD